MHYHLVLHVSCPIVLRRTESVNDDGNQFFMHTHTHTYKFTQIRTTLKGFYVIMKVNSSCLRVLTFSSFSQAF
jgi:hypothetical protein